MDISLVSVIIVVSYKAHILHLQRESFQEAARHLMSLLGRHLQDAQQQQTQQQTQQQQTQQQTQQQQTQQHTQTQAARIQQEMTRLKNYVNNFIVFCLPNSTHYKVKRTSEK